MGRGVYRMLFVVAALTACSASDESEDLGHGHDQTGLPEDAEPLSCKSYSLDATASTVRYDDQTLPELAGGKMIEGLYRRMYTLTDQPVGEGAQAFDANEEADALLFANGRVLWMHFGGGVGKYDTQGKTLHLDLEQSCDTETGKNIDTPANDQSFTYGIDEDGNLSLAGTYTLNDEPFHFVSVYRRTQELCEHGTDESFPEQPGADSWHCFPELVANGAVSCSCKTSGDYGIRQ
jgi:hypothetical protein